MELETKRSIGSLSLVVMALAALLTVIVVLQLNAAGLVNLNLGFEGIPGF